MAKFMPITFFKKNNKERQGQFKLLHVQPSWSANLVHVFTGILMGCTITSCSEEA